MQQTQARPSPPRRSPLAWWWVVAAVVAVGAVMVVLAPGMRTAATVAEITVENPHEWNVRVEVSGDGERWLPVGSLAREDTATFFRILDQGETWTFRFSYATVVGPEMAMTRGELEEAGWHVTVPDDFAETLRDADVPPSP